MATTKRELTNRVADKLGIKQETAKAVVQCFLEEMISELASGNRLEFRDFGIFDIMTKRSRTARNPRTGEPVHIPAKRVVHFKAGRLMKERVKVEPDVATDAAESKPEAPSQAASPAPSEASISTES